MAQSSNSCLSPQNVGCSFCSPETTHQKGGGTKNLEEKKKDEPPGEAVNAHMKPATRTEASLRPPRTARLASQKATAGNCGRQRGHGVSRWWEEGKIGEDVTVRLNEPFCALVPFWGVIHFPLKLAKADFSAVGFLRPSFLQLKALGLSPHSIRGGPGRPW